MDKNVLEQLDLLNVIQNKYQDLKLNDEYIWPYLKNKLYGMIIINSNDNRRNLNLHEAEKNKMNLKKSAMHISKEYQCVIFDFYRYDLDSEYNVVDFRNKRITELLTKENISFCNIKTIVQQGKTINEYDRDDYYNTDDMYLMEENYVALDYKFNYSVEELNHRVKTELKLEFNIRNYQVEFSKKSFIRNNYFKEVLYKIKPNFVFINANTVRPELIISAKELGITVYEIQYAAFTRYHLGYDMGGMDYKFSPDGMLLWGEFWKVRDFYSSSIKDVQVIGNSEISNLSKKQKKKKIVFLGQDLFSKKILADTKAFAIKYKDYEVVYKKHPNEKIDWHIESNQIDNLSFRNDNLLDILADATFAVGVTSTALYEAAALGCKVILLEDITTDSLKDLVLEKMAVVTKDISNDFDNIENFAFELADDNYIYAKENDVSLDFNKVTKNLENSTKDEFKDLLKSSLFKNSNDIINTDLVSDLNQVSNLLDIVVTIGNEESLIKRTVQSLNQYSKLVTKNIIILDLYDNKELLNNICNFDFQYVITKDVVSEKNNLICKTSSKYMYFLEESASLYGPGILFLLHDAELQNIDIIKGSCIIEKNGSLYNLPINNKIYKKNGIKSLEYGVFLSSIIFRTNIIKGLKFKNEFLSNEKFIIEATKKSSKIKHIKESFVFRRDPWNTISFSDIEKIKGISKGSTLYDMFERHYVQDSVNNVIFNEMKQIGFSNVSTVKVHNRSGIKTRIRKKLIRTYRVAIKRLTK